MYRFTFTANLRVIGDTESCEKFTASIISSDRDEAILKLSEAVGENFEAEFDTLLKVEEI